jgi:TonB-linked SusC/RagA family outer membrane protein
MLKKSICKILPSYSNAKFKALILGVLFCLGINQTIYAQDKIDLNLSGLTVKQAFEKIQEKTEFKVLYKNADVDIDRKLDLNYNQVSIKAIVSGIVEGTNLGFKIVNKQIIIQKNAESTKSASVKKVKGTVVDEFDEPLAGVSVIDNLNSKGTVTDIDGNFELDIRESTKDLEFSFVGMEKRIVSVVGKTELNVMLKESSVGLDEIVVVGFGTQKKESVTSAISVVDAEDISVSYSPTVSTALAGKLTGVAFRQKEGIPGSSASIQIRNLGNPLYIIDGVEKDAGQFNNIAPTDIESITVLKDASAAVYGVRAANGVILVTTKNGRFGEDSKITFSYNQGFQNWTRFAEFTDAYGWMLGKVHAQNNDAYNPGTTITKEELEKWKAGTEDGYKNFDWYDFIIKENAPITTVSVSATGGSEKIAYYFAATHLEQGSMLGDEHKFKRTNIQSNITAKVMDRLKISMKINGREETRDTPNLPSIWTGGGDYGAPIVALHQNQPMDRPYANDNPKYPRELTSRGNRNFGFYTKDLRGYRLDTWRVLQTNMEAEYDIPIEGLKIKGVYSNYLADNVADSHRYPVDLYTYDKNSDEYSVSSTAGSMDRRKSLGKVYEDVYQAYLNYDNDFWGNKVAVALIAQRTDRRSTRTTLVGAPKTKVIPLMYFDDLKSSGYGDSDYDEARVGYVGKFNYEYKRKYYAEFMVRRDGSWKFSPEKRWGTFPAGSIGWRITEEPFVKPFIEKISLDVKLRASYGVLGDDNVGIGSFDYLTGYNYNKGTTIIGGESVVVSRDRGRPVDNISWTESKMFNIGLDYSLLNGTINGTFDVFRRKRTGLKGTKDDIVLPAEVGFDLPQENVNSDQHQGIEFSVNYNGNFKDLNYSVGANVSYSRRKFLESYNPRFNNSWHEYRSSSEGRYTGLRWALVNDGQFQSYDEIRNFPIDIDGDGNRSLRPGDIKYKDFNGDGKIDDYDLRPVGYPGGSTPLTNFGFNISAEWNGIDFRADFSGAAGYSYMRDQVYRNPFENEGALLKDFLDNSWHRKDPFDPNSEWVSGKYPPMLFNNWTHISRTYDPYSWRGLTSDFWLKNIWYIRARTIEIGYTIPKQWLEYVKLTNARFYVNGNNLFSIDNADEIGIDPENAQEAGMAYPQHKTINFGVKLTL